MAGDRRRRSLLARIRDKLAEPEPATEPVVETAPEPSRIVHEFGSQYRVRMTVDEVFAARGCDRAADLYRRRLVAPGDTQRLRDNAAAIAGRAGQDVMWDDQ